MFAISKGFNLFLTQFLQFGTKNYAYFCKDYVKKFLSISLLFLYLVASIGLTVSLHYCGGNLASLGLFETPTCCCDDLAEKKKDDCCKNENKSFKITTDQNQVAFAEKKIQCPSPFLPVYNTYKYNKVALLPTILVAFTLPQPPERSNLLPVYKRNHSMLFYS